MKQQNSYNEYVSNALKDFLIIVLIFVGFYFIDIELASFISVITTVILLTRRVILDLNPGFVRGHYIVYHDKELEVPKGVDIFDLSTVSSIKYLYKYIEVIRSILKPPFILIIRFSGITEINEYEMNIICESITRLQNSGIVVILSDIGLNIQKQFRQCGIERKVGEGNIFDNIEGALTKAKLLKAKRPNKTDNPVF